MFSREGDFLKVRSIYDNPIAYCGSILFSQQTQYHTPRHRKQEPTRVLTVTELRLGSGLLRPFTPAAGRTATAQAALDAHTPRLQGDTSALARSGSTSGIWRSSK